MNDQEQLNIIDILSIVSMLLSFKNYQMNIKQSTNDDLMDEMKDVKNVMLEKIIAQNEEIITLLKKEVE